MHAHRTEFRIETMCRVLEVSRSCYYHFRRRRNQSSFSSQKNAPLVTTIREIHRDSKGTYGVRRVTAQLRRQGILCNRKRVAKIMQDNQIRAKTKRRFKRTTHASTTRKASENLVQQRFVAERINQLWTSDMTYIWTREGWLYLSVILDVFGRRIVGYGMSRRLTAELVTTALQSALTQRTVKGGMIFHSDRGSQYASADVREILTNNNITQSMSSTGNCYDNAITETFFHTLKTEMVHWERFDTRDEARRKIFEYIEVFYNRQRLHSSLGYRTPVEAEQDFLNQQQ